MKIIYSFLLCCIIACNAMATDAPSVSQVMKDYNYVYLAFEAGTLDTTVYNITDNDAVIFPDYRENMYMDDTITHPSGFDSSEVHMNFYKGYFSDTLHPQCVVLVSPESFYPAGPIWGIPCCQMFVYTKVNQSWKLSYACPFYYEAEPVILDEKSKLSLLFVRIDYGAMGVFQWVECLYRFKKNRPIEIYYELTSSDAMRIQMSYMDDKSSYNDYEGGDTLEHVILKEEFKDTDADGIKEMICRETITISAKPRDGEFQTIEYYRMLVYHYKKGKLLLHHPGPYKKEE